MKFVSLDYIFELSVNKDGYKINYFNREMFYRIYPLLQ